MDTLQFLDIVLPRTGFRCASAVTKEGFRNFFGQSNDWLAETAARFVRNDLDAYFGCASFSDKRRQQACVEAVRSFWIDIDTQESKPKETYANRKEAMVALTEFCTEVGVALPMVVSSGYGLHAYWPCTEDMTEAEWKETALLLKAATKVGKLAVDQTRTADSASVLRPVGTYNLKNGLSKEVKVVRECQPVDRAEFHVAIYKFLHSRSALPEQTTKPAADVPNLNSDLIVTPEYKPSSAHRIAKHCAVVHEMREKRGDIDQPTWYGCVGVLAFTEEGRDICHEWSDGHAGYSKHETDAKVDQALKYAPTSCERLSDGRPDLCGQCPHFGNIKSPITLGIAEREPQYVQIDPDEELPDLPYRTHPDLPGDFGWGNLEGRKHPVMWYLKREKDPPSAEGPGGWSETHIPWCDTLFFPTTHISEHLGANDSAFKMALTLNHKKGRQVDFVIDTSVVASGRQELISELGKRGIMVSDNNLVQKYLKEWASKLQRDYTEVRQVKQFGWDDRNFVIGDLTITAKGDHVTLLAGSAPGASKPLHTSGDLEAWQFAVNRLFNQPGMQAQQFCFLSSFAAPLYKFLEEQGGITVYIGTGGSSFGKTTACKAGLTIWGDGMNRMALNQFTTNALFEHVGVRNNLPVVADEMTNVDPEFVSNLVFSMNNGSGKLRLTADSVMKDTATWSTIFIGNGNNLLSEKLAGHRSNAEGELMRLFEFTPRRPPPMTLAEFNQHVGVLKENYGHAGVAFARYMVENFDVLKARLNAKLGEVEATFQLRSEERNWCRLFTTVLVAMEIIEELDLLHFNVADMRKWIGEEIQKYRASVSSSVADPTEQFARMLSHLQTGILVTRGRGDLSRPDGAAGILMEPRSEMVGRHIYPEDNNTRETLFLSVAAGRKWATTNGVPFSEIQRALRTSGVLVGDPRRVKLGQGVPKYAGASTSISCWEIDVIRMNGVIGDDLLATKVKLAGEQAKPATSDSIRPIRPADPYDIDDLISG